MYAILPEDLLVLLGLFFVMTQQWLPFPISYKSYDTLKKKIAYAPQNPIVFGIVWYTLYLFIAVAVFLVFLQRASLHTWVVYADFSLFFVIAVTIKVWPILFFTLHDALQQRAATALPTNKRQKVDQSAIDIPPVTAYVLAFLDTLLLLVALCCFSFFCIFGDPAYGAGYWVPALLMAPAIAWVSFACYLNVAAMVVENKKNI